MHKLLKKQINIRKRLGTMLILSSLGLLAYVYYPILQLYFVPESIIAQTPPPEGIYLQIPKIGAAAPVIADVDPWNENEYLPVLQKGIALARGSALPGENGTIFLFAHSSVEPWRMTRINTAFLRLGELAAGDVISIYKDGREFKYTVDSKKEVWPTEVEYLKNLTSNQLVLQTCTPVGTSLKRLLVFANPVKIALIKSQETLIAPAFRP